MGLLDEQTPEQAELKRLENLWAQLQLGTVRIEDAMAQLGPGGERDQMAAQLAQMQQQAAQTGQQLSGMGQQPNPAIGQQLNAQLQQPPQGAPQQPQAPQQPPQGMGAPPPVPGLLDDPAASGGFKPTMAPQAINELYGIMAAGADDPNAIGMNYVQRMQYNDMLKNNAQNQLSQARTGGFNPVVDNQGRVWFPKRQADGSTGLTPALDADGKQIKSDPRWSTIDLGGGGTGMVPTSGGAGAPGGPSPYAVTSPDQVQANEDRAATLAKQAAAKRSLPALENAFAREGGAYDVVSKLIDHPSRELMTGASTVIGTPWSYIGVGSDAQDFRTQEEKLKSQAFINSIQELRATGATVGQITEREGDKLQAAALALNRAANEGDYLAELQTFQAALARFMIMARQEAGEENPFASAIGDAGIDLSWIQQAQQATSDPASDPLVQKYLNPSQSN